LKLAFNRVGGTSRERLRWLLDFASRKITETSEGQRLDLAWEIVAFISEREVVPLPGGKKSDVRIVSYPKLREQSIESRDAFIGTVPGCYLPIALRLKRLFEHGECDYTINHSVTYTLVRSGLGFVTQRCQATLKTRFMLQAFDLLAQMGERVRRCADPKCGRLFLATKRKQFCSPRCSQRVRIAAWRERHRKVYLKQRRAAYKKRLERKLGRKVRIQPRGGSRRERLGGGEQTAR
jgi:hypothetical protein